MKYQGDYINGSFNISKSPSGTFNRSNPGDLSDVIVRVFYSVSNGDKAVNCSREAFKKWRDLPIAKRISYMQKYQSELVKEKEQLAEIISREVGKPLWESLQEVSAMINKVNISIEDGLKLVEGFELKQAAGDIPGKCIYKPQGVLAVLGPFNFPGHLPNGHIIPALLTGNCVVFKPSELTPLTGQFLAELLHRIGLPKGVFNLIQGDGKVGSTLVKHEGIDGVLFTGSYQTGLAIRKATLDQPNKILALEMGERNSTIVMDDAELDFALHETLFSSLATTGQRCTSTSKIILQKKIANAFIERFVQQVKQLKIGYALDENKPFMGPLISDKAVKNFMQSQMTATREGHEEILKGQKLTLDRKGYYISPALYMIKGKNFSSPYQKEEIFAPNICFYIVDSLDKAIEIANAADYRLVTSIFSKRERNYQTLLSESNCGLVNWNKSTVGASSKLPFGGGGKSGNHHPTALFASYYCSYPVATLMNKTPSKEVDFSLFSGEIKSRAMMN